MLRTIWFSANQLVFHVLPRCVSFLVLSLYSSCFIRFISVWWLYMICSQNRIIEPTVLLISLLRGYRDPLQVPLLKSPGCCSSSSAAVANTPNTSDERNVQAVPNTNSILERHIKNTEPSEYTSFVLRLGTMLCEYMCLWPGENADKHVDGQTPANWTKEIVHPSQNSTDFYALSRYPTHPTLFVCTPSLGDVLPPLLLRMATCSSPKHLLPIASPKVLLLPIPLSVLH